MTQIQMSTFLPQSAEVVFDFVTTPGHWPQWHPSSLGVSGAADHSMDVGEQVTEEFRVAGRAGRVVWTCRAREAPRRWVIDGAVDGGGGGIITYMLTPHGSGTRFERTFVYQMPTWWAVLLDHLFVRRRIEAESARALEQLRRVLAQREPAEEVG